MSKLSVHQRKARGYIQREDWGNALAELQRMLGADGDNPTLHNQIGDVYLRKDEVPRACEHFERAIELYSSVGLHNNAVALCKKVMRLRPGRHEMRYRLARLRLEQGFRNEAAVYMREYFEHVALEPSRIDAFEHQCRESIELLEDLAPVGKILEKLEAARLYNVAFDIVRKEAQRAADAGDDKTATRFTEKMRSLRILVERNGSRDLLAETKSAESAPGAEPAPGTRTGSDAVIGAPPATEPASLLLPESPAAAAPSRRSFIDPNRLPGLDPLPRVDASGAAAEAMPAAAESTAEEHAAPIVSEPEPEDVVASKFDHDAAPVADPEIGASAAPETDAGLQIEAASARLMLPELDDSDSSAMAGDDDTESVAADDAADSPVPEFEIHDSTFADLDTDLGTGLSRGAAAGQTDAATAWNFQSSSWTGDATADELADAPAGNGGGDTDMEEPLHPEPQLQPAPPPAASWVDALRRTPLWIPPESAPPSATPEGWSSGANMELESVIDSFREQMARALDGDGAARYDLGVAYYEMGLYNEALAEFEAAAHCPGLEVQSYEMLAACLLHTGRHAEVVGLLLPVLAAEGHSPRGRLGLQYSLGLAYESLGDRDQARRCFEEVALVDIDFKDVQTRLQRIP